MTFNSWQFLLFYPIVTLLYFVLPKKAKAPLLLLASYYFYLCYRPVLILLILGTTAISYAAGRIIDRSGSTRVKKAALIVAVVASLGVLFFFKYFDFLSESVTGVVAALGGEARSFTLDLALPVGISFYTFQTLSYVIDVWRGRIEAEKSPLYYALYVAFFPQLVAGPIERPENLLPQLKESHVWSDANAIAGGKMMMLGFFKKICVADLVSVAVDAVYNNPHSATGLGIVVATILFTVQIYCDFSGYTDIAIGCARVMGIRLMKNFDHPYASESLREFWNRWHISLSSWLRDYIYFPLGGSRCSAARAALNLMIVFLASGFWHGAAWTFVIWGILHGVLRVIENLTRVPREKLLQKLKLADSSIPVRLFRRVVTFALVAFCWIFFRANSLSDAVYLIRGIFTLPAVSLSATFDSLGLTVAGCVLIVLAIMTLALLDRLVTYDSIDEPNGSSRVLTQNGVFAAVTFCIFVLWMLLLSRGTSGAFIYFAF